MVHAVTAWPSLSGLRRGKDLADQGTPECCAIGNEIIVEVITRIVDHAPARGASGAIADKEIAAGDALQHESKVLTGRDGRTLRRDAPGTKQSRGHRRGQCRTGRIIDQHGIPILPVNVRLDPKAAGLLRDQFMNALFE